MNTHTQKKQKKTPKTNRYKISYKDILYNMWNIANVFNNYKWNGTFKNCESLLYTWNLYNIIYQVKWSESRSVVSHSLWPHGVYSNLCSQLLEVKCKSLSHVRSLWLMDYIVRGILQARILEWVAFPFSRGSSQPRDWTQVSCIAGRFFTSWSTREAQEYWSG